jgi:LSD1 subclass zinc finger protein
MLQVFDKFWKEVRCSNCRTLLAYEYIFNGRLMIKCPKCNEHNVVNYKDNKGAVQELLKNFDTSNPDNELILNRKEKSKGGD